MIKEIWRGLSYLSSSGSERKGSIRSGRRCCGRLRRLVAELELATRYTGTSGSRRVGALAGRKKGLRVYVVIFQEVQGKGGEAI